MNVHVSKIEEPLRASLVLLISRRFGVYSDHASSSRVTVTRLYAAIRYIGVTWKFMARRAVQIFGVIICSANELGGTARIPGSVSGCDDFDVAKSRGQKGWWQVVWEPTQLDLVPVPAIPLLCAGRGVVLGAVGVPASCRCLIEMDSYFTHLRVVRYCSRRFNPAVHPMTLLGVCVLLERRVNEGGGLSSLYTKVVAERASDEDIAYVVNMLPNFGYNPSVKFGR
ncbi:hypothetical protein SCHPADRAFT_893888 [Schizopora paradoxa]|uniref:Uncharacterized protein n=1 Tax=Schizopora paradoxa TaxID=27342 RepID=A0A0H2R9C8_9AGAM|nr:hypothetical protein SCHPADRAFT_893888 [Schizopora paradoxa]